MSLWTDIDVIRCINLREREDRFRSSSLVFSRLGIPVQYYAAERHPGGGEQGCYESHIAVIREAYEGGAETLLVFEDDVEIAPSYDGRYLETVRSFLRSGIPWDLLYLGMNPEIFKKRTTKVPGIAGPGSIYKVSSLLAHAYLISRPFMEKLVKGSSYVGVPIDVVYMYNKRAYGLYPSLFFQDTSTTSIEGHGYSELGLKSMWFRGAEMYATYVNVPLLLVLIVAGIGFLLLIVLFIVNPRERLAWLGLLLALLLFGLLVATSYL